MQSGQDFIKNKTQVNTWASDKGYTVHIRKVRLDFQSSEGHVQVLY